MAYYPGSSTLLTGSFFDNNGNPADPTTVTMSVIDPSGTVTQYTSVSTPPITHASTGVYTIVIALTLAGYYSYQWVGTGAIVAVMDGSLPVLDNLIGPQPTDLCSLPAVKSELQINLNDTSQDDKLWNYINAAGLMVLWRTGEMPADGTIPSVSPFNSVVTYTNEVYDGNGNNRLFLRHRPAQSVASVQIYGVSIPQSTQFTVAGWKLDANGKALVMYSPGGGRRWGRYGTGSAGYNGSDCGYVWSLGTQNIAVTYNAGYAQVPFDLRSAVIETIALNWARRKHLDVKSNTVPEIMGTTVYQDWELTPRAEAIIVSYRRRSMN